MKIIDKHIKLYYFILYLTLACQTVFLVYTLLTSDYLFTFLNTLGIIAVFLLGILLLINFNLARVLMGFVLLIGLFGGIVLTPRTQIVFLSFNVGSFKIPIFYGQPIFLIWLIFHVLASYKIYAGFLTKEYWQILLHKS